MIKRSLITILFFLCPFAIVLATPEAPTQNTVGETHHMGFQEWKKNQVFDARKNLDEFKSPQLSKMAEVEKGQSTVNVENSGDSDQATKEEVPANGIIEKHDEVLPSAEPSNPAMAVDEKAEKLRQLEFNLEIAQGLTIHDYFALYLKNKTKEEMAIAIKKLSPEELSELLVAYRKSLYGLPEQEPSSKTALQ